MAEMLIDGAKLDACLDAEADAIRAKTGGSADIPFDYANNKGFADAIAAIPSGGLVSEIVTVGENSVANTKSATDYISALSTLDLSSRKYLVQIASGYENPVNNQFGAAIVFPTDNCGLLTGAIRYRNGWNCVAYGTAYDAVLVVGSTYKITVLE